MFASSQLWQENLQQSPKAVFYYEWVSPHAAVLIDTGPSNFDVQNMVVVAERERDGVLITALSSPPLSTPPLFRATKAAGRAHQSCKGGSRDKAWADNVTKSNHFSQTGGNPSKIFLIRFKMQHVL